MDIWVSFSNHLGNAYTSYVAITGTMLCFFSGVTLGWASPVLAELKKSNNNPLGRCISQAEDDWIGAAYAIGGTIGPLILVHVLKSLGPKITLALLALLYPIFHLVLALSTTIYLYYISRIALGIGTFSMSAVYVSEISSSKMRGTYLSLGTSFLLAGCLFSYILGPFVSIFTFNLIIVITTSIYIPLFIFTCPESPYFAMRTNGPKETFKILKQLRQNQVEQIELEEIRQSVQIEETGSCLEVFGSKASSRAFFLCTTLLIILQFSGNNVLSTYYEQFFDAANVPVNPKLSTIIVSIIQTSTSWITPVSARFLNRKLLLSVSLAGLCFSHSLLALYFSFDSLRHYYFLPLFSLISLVIFYNCGLGSLPWAAMGELYPQNVKSVGTAMSNTIYWFLQSVLTLTFNEISNQLSFCIFALICASGIFFVQICLIETRGKSLREIQEALEE